MLYGIHIGLNYAGSPYALKGCLKDAEMLRRRINANTSEVFASIDFETLEKKLLSKRYKVNDTLFLTFSGHGSLVEGEACIVLEKDNRMQFVKNAAIDQLLNRVQCRVVCIWDSCNSGGLAKQVSKDTLLKEGYKCKSIPYVKDAQIIKPEAHAKRAIINTYICEIFACKETEFAFDSPNGGFFTIGLCNAPKDRVTAMTAFKYACMNCFGHQHPNIEKTYNPQIFKQK